MFIKCLYLHNIYRGSKMLKKISLIITFITLLMLNLSGRTVIKVDKITKNTGYNSATVKNAPYKILFAKLSHNVLFIKVEYLSKWPYHNFTLYWNGSLIKTHPPIVKLHLHAKANKGTTGHKWTKRLYFNVKKFPLAKILLYNGAKFYKKLINK